MRTHGAAAIARHTEMPGVANLKPSAFARGAFRSSSVRDRACGRTDRPRAARVESPDTAAGLPNDRTVEMKIQQGSRIAFACVALHVACLAHAGMASAATGRAVDPVQTAHAAAVQHADANTHTQAHAREQLASLRLEHDPAAPVWIVTGDSTWRGLAAVSKQFAVDAAPTRDSLGTPLRIAKIQAGELSRVSAYVHQRELRCGGYFAFRTQAEAEAFVRADQAASAVGPGVLATYSIDNRVTVDPWLPQVQHTNIYTTIDTLSAYQNRYYTSADGKASAEWIRSRWQSLAGSRSDVTSELSTCANCSTQPSVILTVRGSELPNEIVVLGAHLDSINGSGGGSTAQRAPGADDDASGIATLTEVIRIALASGWKPKRTVKFIGYAAEEVGLRGSNAIAQAHRNAGANVYAVLQLDMTNYRSGGADMRLITDYSNADIKTFLTSLFDTYLAPLGLTRGTYTCGYGCSDHASWTSAGYPAGMMFEGGASGYFSSIHTQNDTLANMGNSAQNSGKFAKLGLAFLGEAAKTAGSGGGGATEVLNVALPAIARGSWSSTYTVSIPAGTTRLVVTTAGGSGDADLYVRAGAAPTSSAYTCRPYLSGNNETCTIDNPAAGATYYIRVYAYAAFSGVTLKASRTP